MTFTLDRYRDLIAHTDQVAGSRLSRVIGGTGDGGLILTVWTPTGIEVDLQVDRALDILSVRHHGIRFGWAGPTGVTPRTLFEPAGFGWQRSFYGGLLTTCGLEHVGDPISAVPSDQHPPGARNVDYGEHGRIGHSAADLTERTLDEDVGVFRIRGLIRQGAIYDERFQMLRTIEIALDRPEITIRDIVTNDGPLPARHAILYHLNVGYPVAAAGTRVRAGGNRYVVPELTATSPELVQRWDSRDGEEQTSEILTPSGDRVLSCTQSASLPTLFLWNAPRRRTNVLGLAPSSAPPDDQVEHLASGDTRKYMLKLAFGDISEGAAN
ncbi:DUF4432 family protein [Microbacterium keratanolyticum]